MCKSARGRSDRERAAVAVALGNDPLDLVPGLDHHLTSVAAEMGTLGTTLLRGEHPVARLTGHLCDQRSLPLLSVSGASGLLGSHTYLFL